MDKPVIFNVKNKLGIMTLNRPSHLNALSLNMINDIIDQLKIWQDDDAVQAILITSDNPKAFCVGGDIRYLYDTFKENKGDYREYFTREYLMLDYIRRYEKTIIVTMNGFVLGGGMGLAQACHILISTEKSKFAMPETAIGFFPDVGATHFLSRLDNIGVYLALTGDMIEPSDALALDLIDFYVPEEKLSTLLEDLSATDQLSKEKINVMIAKYVETPKISQLKHLQTAIDQHFMYESIQEIETSLANEKHIDFVEWAEKTLATLKSRSNSAKEISLKLQIVGRKLSLSKCLQVERELQNIWFEYGDISEGIRALLIDKDKKPQWKTDYSDLMEISNKILQ